jgi:hypothetical protein
MTVFTCCSQVSVEVIADTEQDTPKIKRAA